MFGSDELRTEGEPYNEKSNGCRTDTNCSGYKIQYDKDGLHPLTGVKGIYSTLSELEVYQLVIQ
jgi:hypothetical protein